jgi:hypothetical protein
VTFAIGPTLPTCTPRQGVRLTEVLQTCRGFARTAARDPGKHIQRSSRERALEPLPSKTSWFDGPSQINFLGAPSMKWPCLVAAGGGLDGGADFVGEHQPDPERAARVWAERVRRILPLPRANNLERLER